MHQNMDEMLIRAQEGTLVDIIYYIAVFFKIFFGAGSLITLINGAIAVSIPLMLLVFVTDALWRIRNNHENYCY